MVAETEFIVGADDLKLAVEEGNTASMNSSLGPDYSGGRLESVQTNARPLGKLPVARNSRNAFPSGSASTDRVMEADDGKEKKMSMMFGVSTPKLIGT